MFGFIENASKYTEFSPIALPEQYGSFSVYVGDRRYPFIECDSSKHFKNVEIDEGKANFFPDARL